MSRAPISFDCETGPHEFTPLRRWRNQGRCVHCYLHERVHPVVEYTPSRPYLDERLPVIFVRNGPIVTWNP